jgi:hypothetical protein
MEIAYGLPKYSFKEKFFKISPEEKIGRTDYTARIIFMWLVFYIGGSVAPLILMKNGTLPVILPVLMFIYICM